MNHIHNHNHNQNHESETFYTLILDNFFNDPNYVRKLGIESANNKVKLKNTSNSYYRGKRSEHMSTLDINIYKKIITTLGKLYLNSNFDVDYYQDIRCTCEFQLTDETWNVGWVHHDSCFVTSIIYLNPVAPPNTGTNLYVPKSSNITTQLHSEYHKKTNFSPELRNTEEYTKKHKENNDQFVETMSIQNKYNRLISYFGCYWHCGANHFGNTNETSRLTIVTQIHDFGKSLVNRKTLPPLLG